MDMRNGYKMTLGILTIMILITITIGTSYSYYSISDEQTTSNELITACFDISYDDQDGSNAISLNSDGAYAYPMSEITALGKLTPYTFTIKNNCTSANNNGINYVVTLNTLTTTPSTLTNYIRYKLNTSTIEGTSALLTTSPYDLNTNVKLSEDIDTSYSLASGNIAAGESITYSLYLWIDENAGNDIMGTNFTGKVLVYTYQ